MTATEEEAPPAAGLDSGLTADDLAEIMAVQAIVFRVCSAAAGRVLAAERPAVQDRVTELEEWAAEARTALEPMQAIVTRLQDELAECRRRAEGVKLAADDESLTVRLEARSLRVAIEEETRAIEARLQVAMHDADPYHLAARDADRELTAATRELADLDQALEMPFIHWRGQVTGAYEVYALRTGLWHDIGGNIARRIMKPALADTGYGREIEENALKAYAAGDPAARNVAGDVKHFGDGNALINSPDGVPLVVHGAATPEGLAAAPVVPRGPAPSAVDIAAGMHSGAGWPQQQAVTKARNSVDQDWPLPEAIRRVWR